jgi:hypothetical protein
VRRITPYLLGLVLAFSGKLLAQRILYTPSSIVGSSSLFQMIGRSGEFYWLAIKKENKINGPVPHSGSADIGTFLLLDSKLRPLAKYPPIHLPGTIKQWLLSGEEGLDQLVAVNIKGTTHIYYSRFRPDSSSDPQPVSIDSLPFSADASRMLLIRCEDRTKILLIAFENTDSEQTRVHALLFNSNWTCIYHRVISHEQFAQPCIQEDETGLPGESFDDLPIKLANNGEWLMVAPSRISCNFSIFHVSPHGSEYYFHEIPLSPFYKMEDIAMSINENEQMVSMGLLSAYSNTSLKDVQVYNYSMKEGKIVFDSAFHFNTQYRAFRSHNLFHERFVAVPGEGFLLMMEYGRPYAFDEPRVPVFNYWESAYLFSDYAEMELGKKSLSGGYTQNTGLRPIPLIRNAGDLNLFYFPSVSRGLTWSGVLETEQHAENNNPDLSYLVIPERQKIYLAYNLIDGFSTDRPTAMSLDLGGKAADEPLLFWQMGKTLDFQGACRFSKDEVFIPYVENQPAGFAIIRMK